MFLGLECRTPVFALVHRVPSESYEILLTFDLSSKRGMAPDCCPGGDNIWDVDFKNVCFFQCGVGHDRDVYILGQLRLV